MYSYPDNEKQSCRKMDNHMRQTKDVSSSELSYCTANTQTYIFLYISCTTIVNPKCSS